MKAGIDENGTIFGTGKSLKIIFRNLKPGSRPCRKPSVRII